VSPRVGSTNCPVEPRDRLIIGEWLRDSRGELRPRRLGGRPPAVGRRGGGVPRPADGGRRPGGRGARSADHGLRRGPAPALARHRHRRGRWLAVGVRATAGRRRRVRRPTVARLEPRGRGWGVHGSGGRPARAGLLATRRPRPCVP